MVDELAHFVWIVEHGTLTAASRRAHLSQPALTASVHRLEAAFGARLLDRGPGGARPTAAGRALLPWAQQVLSALDRGRRAVAEIEGLHAGEVRLAAGSTACAVFLPVALTAFRAQHPAIRLTLREAMDGSIARDVESGLIDLGISADRGTERWLDDELVLVAAPGIPSAGLPHLSFPIGANHRTLLDRFFPEVDIAMELSSLAAVRAHVEQGMGVALLSRASVAREIAEGRLVVLDHPRTPIRRTLHLLHLGVERLSPAARALRTELMRQRPAD